MMEEQYHRLHTALDSQTEQLKRLEEQVVRLGQGSSELTRKVAEVQADNASQLELIAGMEREVEEWRSGVAGVNERPAIVAESKA